MHDKFAVVDLASRDGEYTCQIVAHKTPDGLLVIEQMQQWKRGECPRLPVMSN